MLGAGYRLGANSIRSPFNVAWGTPGIRKPKPPVPPPAPDGLAGSTPLMRPNFPAPASGLLMNHLGATPQPQLGIGINPAHANLLMALAKLKLGTR